MIVADTNLLVYLFVPGEHTGAAESVWTADAAWAAPLLWRSEFRNVLVGFVRRRIITPRLARRIAAHAEFWMNGREFLVPTPSVLRMAAASNCSAYDCEYVALASDLKVPLVTADSRILRAFPNVAVHPTSFGT